MLFTPTKIPQVIIVEPKVFGDERGYFFESFRKDIFDQEIPGVNFVQDNESLSMRGVLRGLHYQLPPMAQSKLVRVVQGRVLDVVVDIRRSSPYFGQHVAVELSQENKCQLFIPKGFAHGFIVLSQKALFQYKVDNYYSREHDRGILFHDPDLGIDWILKQQEIVVSGKDAENPLLKNADVFD
ncbi:dTDP-4-dehydrorhamnose 3,5-epimerase [Desulfonatronovibrio magnus]|uniref:dTDP-4-dehydrorhamnose 3,5-epimerase n=1 Tax=Desulfonatronovibrio magnus TaxID=698827 RepID=UPI0005EB0DEC|nr:dTDP-4-dehydrorhamnose 3,5-epimerase [Desulfonatronovibrio magnus]